MKWIEMIRVRSYPATIKEKLPSLKKMVIKMNQTSGADQSFIVQHAQYQGDLSIVVVWNNEMKPVKTKEGLLFAEWFSNLGSVEHAVWIPVKE